MSNELPNSNSEMGVKGLIRKWAACWDSADFRECGLPGVWGPVLITIVMTIIILTILFALFIYIPRKKQIKDLNNYIYGPGGKGKLSEIQVFSILMSMNYFFQSHWMNKKEIHVGPEILPDIRVISLLYCIIQLYLLRPGGYLSNTKNNKYIRNAIWTGMHIISIIQLIDTIFLILRQFKMVRGILFLRAQLQAPMMFRQDVSPSGVDDVY